MPQIILDGHKIETSPGKTIIQAAYENGMQIPHFCWHPELSVAGNCRMCLVEVGNPKRLPNGEIEKDANGEPVINFFPKLQIACATPINDGMVIRSKSAKAIAAQEAVMEFLLINHPLDCPICDEAGECKLQEYAFTHSKGESRFDEVKNHKEKRQVWGPNVLYDAERCISCSRCIRYAQEVANQDVLTFVQRGDHVTIELFDGTVFDNPYSMNVIEICPVGALTSQNFRFKSRVWDMSFNDTITPADGSGNNIRVGVRNNEILRVEPSTNMNVNHYWLTDDQRLNHHEFVNENRVTEPSINQNGSSTNVSWEDALSYTVQNLSALKPDEIFVVASPRATTEDNYMLNKFAKTILKTNNIDYLTHFEDKFEDNKLSSGDRYPNTAGVVEVGIKSGSINFRNLEEKIKFGQIKAIIVMEENFEFQSHLLEIIKEVPFKVVMQYNHNNLTNNANVVLPASTFAEVEGTYINVKKRVQHLKPFIVTKENLRYMGMKMSRLDKFGAYNDRWTQHEHRNSKQSWKVLQLLANLMGAGWTYKSSKEVFAEIEKNIPSFKGMTYGLLDENQGVVLGKASNPESKKTHYVSHVMVPH